MYTARGLMNLLSGIKPDTIVGINMAVDVYEETDDKQPKNTVCFTGYLDSVCIESISEGQLFIKLNSRSKCYKNEETEEPDA